MDATRLDTFVCALIDEQSVLAVLAVAVLDRNLFDHVIAQAVAAAERLGWGRHRIR